MDNMMTNIGEGIVLTDEQYQQELIKRREELQLAEGQRAPGCPQCGYDSIPGLAADNNQDQQ